MKEYRNYLFDLYGTLADIHTDEESLRFWRGCCRLLGMQGAHYRPRELKENYAQGIAALEAAAREGLEPGGQPEIDLAPVFRSFFENRGIPADERCIADFARAFRLLSLRKLRLFPGVIPMLQQLRSRGCRVYLLSNAQALFTRPELELLGLTPCFDGILLSSELGRKKPDPAFFQAMLTRYGLEPAETAMVGNDDVCDCHGAARAGLDSFYVFTEQSPAPAGPLPDNCITLNAIADLAHLRPTEKR